MKRSVAHFTELLLVMTEKELRVRYKNTIFGFFWLAVNPLLQMFVVGFVFSYFIKEPIPHYNYYLFIGLLIWSFFSLSLTKATPSIVFERALIKKASFPREVIPLSIILSNIIHFFVALMIYIVPILFIRSLTLMDIFYIVCGLILLVSFTIGLSLLTTTLNVVFRDINFFVQALLIIWFYATPILYSFSIIPYRYIALWSLNPLTSVVQLFQHGFVGAPLPEFSIVCVNVSIMMTVCVMGFWLFKRESKNFDDWV